MAQQPRSNGGGSGVESSAVNDHVVLSPLSSASEVSLSDPHSATTSPAIGTADARPTSSKQLGKSPSTTGKSPTLEPPQTLQQRPSITFSAQMDRRRSKRGDVDGDETVPIIGREQGGGVRDYQSISPRIRAKGQHDGALDAGNGTQRERQEREAQEAAVAAEAKDGKWWKGVLEKYGSVELENKGSVARDHLALERTFLAWLRTSLSFASIGIAITQLFRLNTAIASGGGDGSPADSPRAKLRHVGKPLGATFIAISILILFIGFHRYFESQHYVIRGKFPASRGSILIVSAVAGGLIVTSLVVVLAIAPSAFEK